MIWFKDKDKALKCRTVDLPGDVGSVSIPADFMVEMEDDSTLMAYPQGEEAITLRFSSISISSKGGNESIGKSIVRKNSREKGIPCDEASDKVVLAYEEVSSQDGVPLVIKFWEVGSRNTVVIISATIIKGKEKSKVVKRTLEAMPAIVSSVKITTVYKILESEDRRVEAVRRTVEPTPQSIRPFGPDEEEWLETYLRVARALAVKYGSGGALDPEELDRVFSRWLAEDEEKEPNGEVANVLGAAFGSYLVEKHGFRWMLLADEYGTEYVVRHRLGELTAFPRASVEKRIESRQPEFFQNVSLIILEELKHAEQSG